MNACGQCDTGLESKCPVLNPACGLVVRTKRLEFHSKRAVWFDLTRRSLLVCVQRLRSFQDKNRNRRSHTQAVRPRLCFTPRRGPSEGRIETHPVPPQKFVAILCCVGGLGPLCVVMGLGNIICSAEVNQSLFPS